MEREILAESLERHRRAQIRRGGTTFYDLKSSCTLARYSLGKQTTSSDLSLEVVMLVEQPVYKPGPVGLRK